MNVIEADKSELNGFVGDLINSIIRPGGSQDQTEVLTNELYLKDQQLAQARSNTTYALIAAGTFAVVAGYFGYQLKKKK